MNCNCDPVKTIVTWVAILGAIVGSLFLIKVLDISYPLSLTTTSRSGELAVVGEGKVDVVPDTSYIDAGISVNKLSTVEEVQKKLTLVNDNIIVAMQALGIDKSDIKTSNFSINPNYKYENNENKIDGYNGIATITIKVTNPSTASKVISQATGAGANQIQGVRFVVDKPEKYREEARAKAIENAKDQAAKMTAVLGIKLGRIVNVVESSPNNYPVPMMKSSLMEGAGGGGGPIVEPGAQTVSSTVTLYFEKK